MNPIPHSTPDLDALIGLFYDPPETLGEFQQVAAADLPENQQTLLAHHNHMTVTVEAFHNSSVDLQVLDTNIHGKSYARKILLRRKSDDVVVQYGIVRLDFNYLDDAVCQEIEKRKTPLGRILIEHNVLRQVELVSLWKVVPGEELRKLFDLCKGIPLYGRTALIYCNDEPAVELLEIVTPG